MNVLIFYTLTIIFTLASVMYSKYQFEDVKLGWAKAKGKWHIYGAIQRSIPFLIALLGKILYTDIFLAASICLLLFEIGINTIAMRLPVLYVGSTSDLDKYIGKYKWYILFSLLAAAIFLKIYFSGKF